MHARFPRCIALMALLAAGCMTTPVQRVETLGKGNFEFAAEPGAFGAQGTVLPAFNIAVRAGVGDRVDLGARIGTGIYELQTKFLLTQPGGDGVRLALAPYFTPVFFAVQDVGAGFLSVKLPLLIGIPAGANHELILAPTLTSVTVFGSGGGSSTGLQVFEPGGSIGFSAQLSDNVRVHPEFGLGVGAEAFGATDGETLSTGVGLTRYAFTLGLQFGNYAK